MKFKSLRTRITVWTIAAMLIIPVSVGVVIMVKQFDLANQVSSTIDESDEIFKTTLVRDLEQAMMVNQLNGVREVLGEVSRFDGVKGVYLLDSRGTTVMSFGREKNTVVAQDLLDEVLEKGVEQSVFSSDADGHGSTRLLMLPVMNKGECRHCHGDILVNGALLVRQRSVDVRAETRFLVAIMLTSLLIASIAAALTLLTLLTRRVVSPLRALARVTNRVARSDLDIMVPVQGDGEVAELARSFNHMIEDLKLSRDEVEYRSIKCQEAYQSMQEAQKKLVQSEKLAAIGTLVAGIAHEINNPVGIIAARTDCMLMEAKDKGLDGQCTEDLMVINRHAGRIADITRALLTFARQAPSTLSPVSLNEIVEDTLFLVSRQFTKEGITLEKRLSVGDPRVLGNDNRIQQVLLDLLNNARDAMPDGGKVTVSTSVTDDRAEITITDTGVGIPEAILDKIFDPFFTTKEVGKGTGLGLSVSYGIVQDLRGNIEVRSGGDGTTFVISLPGLKERDWIPA
ncbi:MAG: HAMP domain-containing protein [Nitrospirae bacterium]|nr:HAMP domain-containing protein [Nitrospirota bacterium]